VYVDDLSLHDLQRASLSKTIHNIGTFVNANALRLPFKDKSFDFSFSSHLLEHVTDPDRVIKEIMCVSKTGYLEVPNGILETIKPFHSHLWFVYNNKGTLVFYRKSKKMHDVLTKNGEKYLHIFPKIEDPFIRVIWKKQIKYEIIDLYNEIEKIYTKNKNDSSSLTHAFNIYIIMIMAKILRLLFYKEKLVQESIYKTKVAKKPSEKLL
jgi:ubiquinone/menaquinone biosynthesis C-methylase UbiE